MAFIHCEYTDRCGYLARMRVTGTAAGAGLVVCWSSGFVGAEFGSRAAPIDTVLAWRTMVAALILGGWVLARRTRVSPTAMLRQVVLGLLVQVLYLAGVFAAAGTGVAAGTSALIAAAQPLLVAVLAGPLLGERTTRRQQVGLIAGGAGVVMVVAADLDGGHARTVAYLLPVLALVALATGTLLEQRWRPSESLTTSLALQSAVAAIVFSVSAGARGHLAPPATSAFWAAVAWLVVLSTFGGYGTYLFVVRRSGATHASTLLYLTPPTTALWAWLMFHQVPAVLCVPGVAVCAAGVALTLIRPTMSGEPRRRADGRTRSRGGTPASSPRPDGSGQPRSADTAA